MIPKLVVFAGPPRSGKTTLSQAIAQEYQEKGKGSICIEMDDMRLANLPDSEHNKADRNIAYRLVHSKADEELHNKSLVILVASYANEHIQAVVELAKKWSVRIYLIECRVSPEEAVNRFRHLDPDKTAGLDLTETRVRELAIEFPFYGGGCVVDTSKDDKEKCLATIRNYLDHGSPLWSPDEWVRAAQRDQEKPVTQPQQIPIEVKLSPVSQRNALFKLVAYIIPFAFAGILWVIGFYDLVLALLMKSDILFTEATAYVTAGLFFFAVPPVFPILAKPLKESFGVLRQTIAGSSKLPKYGPIKEVYRSNRKLYRDYQERMVNNEKPSQGFLLPGIPVYFLIKPESGKKFDVVVTPSNKDHKKEYENFQEDLHEEAATSGFDWEGYRSWRLHEKASQYFGSKIWKKYLRAIDITDDINLHSKVKIDGTITKYADYLVAEQSVTLEVPGQLPYMREFFEGTDWWSKKVKLDSLEETSKRYSMIVNLTTLIETKDKYFIFQRRSGQVQSGQGGLTASAAGGVEWGDVNGRRLVREGLIPRYRRKEDRCSLRNTLFREIREELGLLEKDFEEDGKPFIASTLNLRFGRDVSFYALLKCNKSSEDVSKIFNKGRKRDFFRSAGGDRWEAAHLIFIPEKWLEGNDPESKSRRSQFLGEARHANGIVKALRVFNDWEKE